jgi:hypothetical protein
MKIELGQFYLRGEDVYIFTREYQDHFRGTAFQKGKAYSVGVYGSDESLARFIPITPEIAKMVQSTQRPIDTEVV